MHIERLCGSWLDHPFWKKAFVLEEEKDLLALQASGIEEVWIDSSKGEDVELEQVSVAGEQKAANTWAHRTEGEKKPERHVALHEEVQRAQQLLLRAKQVVAAVFEDARKGNVLQLKEVMPLVDEIIQSVSRNSGALLRLSRQRKKDDHTYLHSIAVSALMVALGKQMDVTGNALRSLGLAGLLHDIGKVALPDGIINKPGKLSTTEFDLVKTHSRRGWEILESAVGVDDVVRDVCLHHHERVDGAGYPDKLTGDYLSLYARIAVVCDVYDALSSDWSYRRAYSPADAIRKMTEGQDVHFDKMVFHAFVKTVGIYPSGTLVQLKSGRLAVVTDQSAKSLTTPIVKVFFSTKTNEPVFPSLVDTSKIPDPIASVEDPAEWKFDLMAMAGI